MAYFSCSDCKFLRPFRENSTLGECHRNPPQLSQSVDNHNLWPIVEMNDWCGEYKPSGS